MKRTLIPNAAAVLLAISSVVGCVSKKQPDPTSSVSGTLSYRSDAPLSSTAVAYVRLADVTNGLTSSTTVLQQEVRPSGESPIPFTLNYKEKWINPSHEYAVDVRVVDRGQLLFINDQKQPVITNGHPSEVAMTLERPGRK